MRSLKHMLKVDIHFATRGLQGWPKVWVQVRKLITSDVLVCCLGKGSKKWKFKMAFVMFCCLWIRVWVQVSTLLCNIYLVGQRCGNRSKIINGRNSFLFCCLWPKAGLPIFDFLVALLIFYEKLDFLVALSIFYLLIFTMKVFHQDSLGRNELVGYGFSHIPTSAGL